MRKRIIISSVAIVGCLALVTALILFWWGPPYITGSGGFSLDETNVVYLKSDDEIALVIWTDLHSGQSEAEWNLLSSSRASGFSTSPDGRRVEWEWKAPRKKGGEFQIDGTPFDLANGTLMLVSTKGGKVRVTQLDVDLTQIQSKPAFQAKAGFENLAKNEPRVAKFIAEASEKK